MRVVLWRFVVGRARSNGTWNAGKFRVRCSTFRILPFGHSLSETSEIHSASPAAPLVGKISGFAKCFIGTPHLPNVAAGCPWHPTDSYNFRMSVEHSFFFSRKYCLYYGERDPFTAGSSSNNLTMFLTKRFRKLGWLKAIDPASFLSVTWLCGKMPKMYFAHASREVFDM